MHTTPLQKGRIRRNKRSRHGDKNLVVAMQTTAKTTPGVSTAWSSCSQHNAFNKAIARHNQLRANLIFSPLSKSAISNDS
jgi:hypothetical protein